MYSFHNIFVFIVWNQSLTAPMILSGVGKHIKYKNYALINKVSVSVFYFCKNSREPHHFFA